MIYMFVFGWLVIWVLTIAFYCTYRATKEVITSEKLHKFLTEPIHVLRTYERYKPIECRASVIVSDYSLMSTNYAEDHMRWAVEELVDKILKHVRPYITIKTQKSQMIGGTEITAELMIYEKET